MFPSYDSQGLFHWELLYPAIQRGTVYHIDVLFPLHYCRYNLPCSVNCFSHFFPVYIYIYMYLAGFLITLLPSDLLRPTVFFGQKLQSSHYKT